MKVYIKGLYGAMYYLLSVNRLLLQILLKNSFKKSQLFSSSYLLEQKEIYKLHYTNSSMAFNIIYLILYKCIQTDP